MPCCVKHPERETSYVCQKHEIALCEECLECRDPNIYCKYRSACPIWFIYKENKRAERRAGENLTRKP
ncbi:MAG: hypothetical protein K9K64_16680 [Desulfohalobiaceae bacterium]|nr:hypothetical protein [Desulfohalobiaceae bacterium]